MSASTPTFYGKRPSVTEEATIRRRITKKTFVTANGCLIWTGARTTSGYGKIKVTCCGREQTLRVHRALYFLETDLQSMDSTKQVSHLCNEKLCVNTAHLSLEENVVNMQRKNCFSERRCTGHVGYADCIINQR
ncbi:hypothetical protein Bbelb_357310 [Branchiostoma belcheri]|nr:hypothetical protein Bbelb_357310 [Branchiostoma belcheri]